MHGYAVALVLFAAILHATWNAQLKGGDDRLQFVTSMSLAVGVLALLIALFVPVPTRSAWICIGLSAVLHIAYNLLLIQNYRLSDFASTYPIARGVSPLMVTLGGFLLMYQRPNATALAGVALISVGIIFMATGGGIASRFAILSAAATGVVIAAYTVVNGMGVRRAHNALSYTVWVFVSYLLMPVALLVMRTEAPILSPRSLPSASGAGVLSLAAYGIVLWATQYADLGVVSALRETSVLWAVVIGHAFLGEAVTWRRAISAAFICLGVFLLVALSR